MNKYIAPAQVSHEIFVNKTQEYANLRPVWKMISMRSMRQNLIVKTFDFGYYVDQTCDQLIMTSKTAGQPGGRTTLNFLAEGLNQHSHDVVHNGPTRNKSHVFKNIVYREDIHPDNQELSHYLRGQRLRLQMVAADIEAITLIRSLEDQLVISETITGEEALGEASGLYQLTPEAEIALNRLRVAVCL